MFHSKEFSTPNKHPAHQDPTSPVFEDVLGLNGANLSLIEPIGQPHNHPSTLRGERRKTGRKLNINSSNFHKTTASSPFGVGESINSTFDSATDVTHSSIATESIGQPSQPIIEHLDLPNFKSKPCPIPTQHNHKHCPFYHNAKDRKRPGNAFSSEICEYADNPEFCPYGEKCPRAHNRVEQLYKPEKYKTKFCSLYPNNLALCEYGVFCSFAHSEADINIELIHNYEYDSDFYMFHFKTAWCPFNLTHHDKALCVYAHNWQDYRRKPHIANYDPVPCSHWKTTDFILNYENGCPNRERCNKCHGWKEFEYHPLLYKTKPCTNKQCNKGQDCANYHSNSERRIITPLIMNKTFKLTPRNRVVEGTYKTRKSPPTTLNRTSEVQQVLKMKTPSFIEPAVSREDSLAVHMSHFEFPDDERIIFPNVSQELQVKERKDNPEPFGQKERDSKRRNSVDSPNLEEKIQLRKSADVRVPNLWFFVDEQELVNATKRKWSTNERDPNEEFQIKIPTSLSFNRSIHKRASQNHARELEDDIDSIESSPHLDDDDDGKSIDHELRQNLERIIDDDDI